MILIPLNPTPTDLRALVKGLPVIKRSGKPFNFMLARVRPNLRNNDGVAMALDALGLVLPNPHARACDLCRELCPRQNGLRDRAKGIAAQELAGIWSVLKERIQENEKSGKSRKRERENYCMSKRPPIDLMALTSEQAAPMPEAVQRMTKPARAGKSVAQVIDAARQT